MRQNTGRRPRRAMGVDNITAMAQDSVALHGMPWKASKNPLVGVNRVRLHMLPSGHSAVRPTRKLEGAGEAFLFGEKVRKSYVYFITRNEGKKSAASLKVGVSYDPHERLKQLQTANAATLQLLHYIEAGSRQAAFDIEKRIHHALQSSYRRGEWFAITGATSRLVNALHDKGNKNDFWECLAGRSTPKKRKARIEGEEVDASPGRVGLKRRIKTLSDIPDACKESSYLMGFYSHQSNSGLESNPFGWGTGERPDNRDWWYLGYLDSNYGRRPMVTKSWMDGDKTCPEKAQ